MSDFRFRWQHLLDHRRGTRAGRRAEHQRDRRAADHADARRRDLRAARAESWEEAEGDSLRSLKARNAWRSQAAAADGRCARVVDDLERRADVSQARLRAAAQQHEVVARLRGRLQQRHRRDHERELERERDQRAAWQAGRDRRGRP